MLYISGIVRDEPAIIIDSSPYMDAVWRGIVEDDSDAQKSAIRMRNWVYKCWVVAMSDLPFPDENDRFEERFCRAMAFGVHLEERDTPANDYKEGFQALFTKFGSLAGQANVHPNLLRGSREQGDRCGIYESKFFELSAGRKFCVTKQNYLAWVPVDTKPTDRICLLAGCAVPFVVRPVDQHYELVGDCYREDIVLDAGVEIRQQPQLFEFH